jgi:hypothetical protein
VIGSSNTDLIIRVPRIPRAGETLLGGEFTQPSAPTRAEIEIFLERRR